MRNMPRLPELPIRGVECRLITGTSQCTSLFPVTVGTSSVPIGYCTVVASRGYMYGGSPLPIAYNINLPRPPSTIIRRRYKTKKNNPQQIDCVRATQLGRGLFKAKASGAIARSDSKS